MYFLYYGGVFVVEFVQQNYFLKWLGLRQVVFEGVIDGVVDVFVIEFWSQCDFFDVLSLVEFWVWYEMWLCDLEGCFGDVLVKQLMIV